MNTVYASTLKLLLYDAAGSVVKLQLIGANTTVAKVDVSVLKNGSYFLVLTDGKQLIYKEKIEVLH
jgi:hypothetical protein